MILTRPFRKPLWVVRSFWQKHRRIIGLAAIFGTIVFFLAKNLILFLPKIKPTIKIGVIGQYSFANLPPQISQQVSRGLTKIGPDGQPLPDLALSWDILEAETLYRFKLDPASLWSDGTPVKAKDINLEIPDVVLKIIDDYTLELRLKESFSPFLTVLARPLFKANVGAGNFMIKTVRYSGPYLKRLELTGPKQNLSYRFYPSHEAAWLGFRLGEVNRLDNLLINPLNEAWEKTLNLEAEINPSQYLAVIFNLKHPYLGHKALRQALAYSIKDKASTPEARALSSINPHSWAYNAKVKPYDYNPAQAKELWDRFSEEASLSGELQLTLSTSQSFLKQAEAISADWEKVLGVKTNVKIVSSIEPNFEALLVTQEIPADPDQHALWHSTQDTNITHYSDLKIDKLLEDGRKTSALAKRKEIYQDFQKFLVEDLPVIFLEHPLTYTINRR